MSRPPVVPLADAMRPAGGPPELADLEHAVDPFMGARYVVFRGKRHYVTAGQMARLSGLRFRLRVS